MIESLIFLGAAAALFLGPPPAPSTAPTPSKKPLSSTPWRATPLPGGIILRGGESVGGNLIARNLSRCSQCGCGSAPGSQLTSSEVSRIDEPLRLDPVHVGDQLTRAPDWFGGPLVLVSSQPGNKASSPHSAPDAAMTSKDLEGLAVLVPIDPDLRFGRWVVLLDAHGVQTAGRVRGEPLRLGFCPGGDPFIIDRFGGAIGVALCPPPGSPQDTGVSDRRAVVYDPRLISLYYPPGGHLRTDSKLTAGLPGFRNELAEPARGTLASAQAEWFEGQINAAVSLCREYLLTNDADSDAQRLLGVLLLTSRQPGDAAQAVLSAYEADPDLAYRPIKPDQLPGGAPAIRMRLDEAVQHASSTPSAAAWLMVVVLNQADGRLEPARKFLERAKKAGLPPPVADALSAAVSKP